MGMLCRTVALLGLCGAVVGFALKFTPAVSIINAWGQPFVHAQASSMACGLVLAAAALACEEMLAPGRRKGRASSRPKLRRAANALYVRRVGLLGGAIVAGACVIWAVLTWSFLRRMACDSGEACWHTVARVVSMRAGNAALLPLALLGVPLSKSSALWRAFGQPFEEAVALHRLLGHAAMGLLSFHALGYLVVWTLESSLLEEITDWFDCGRCNHINNSAGLIAWLGGVVLWAMSVEKIRRSHYAAFFLTHRLHLVFFGFGVIHWPPILFYAAPSLIFYAADLAARYHAVHVVRAAVRLHGTTGEPSSAPMVTLLLPIPPRIPSDAPSPSPRAASAGGGCPVASMEAGSGGPAGVAVPHGHPPLRLSASAPDESPDGGVVYLAVRWLARWEWHPFSVAGVVAVGGEDHLLVHAVARERWTRRIAALVQEQTLAQAQVLAQRAGDVGGDVVGDDAPRDTCLSVGVIGPSPAPPELVSLASAGARGAPILLVGGGSGLSPAVAVLHRIAAHARLASDARVRLVCVVRELTTLEMLDRRMLPRNAEGQTGYAWLTAEIHLTGPSAAVWPAPATPPCADPEASPCEPADATEPPTSSGSSDTSGGEPPSDSDSDPNSSSRLAEVDPVEPGAVRLSAAVDACGTPHLVATAHAYRAAATLPGLCGAASRRRGGVLGYGGPPRPQRHEIASLVGATLGFYGCCWPLMWAFGAPLSRGAHSTTVEGVGGLAGTFAAAFAGSCLVLGLVDLAFDVRAYLAARKSCRRSLSRWPAELATRATDLADSFIELTPELGPTTPQGNTPAGEALEPLSLPRAAEPRGDEAPSGSPRQHSRDRPPRMSGMRVHLTSRGRPDAEALVSSLVGPSGGERGQPSGQPSAVAPLVAVGGPPALLRSFAIAARRSEALGAPLVRLTHST